MHPKFQRADELSGQVIAAAIEVHKAMGPGLLESIYERCLIHELQLRNIPVIFQRKVEIRYKGIVFEEVLRFDLLVDDCLLIEIKAVQGIAPVHKAQLLSDMKLLDVPLGLLFNFHDYRVAEGMGRAGWFCEGPTCDP